MQAGWAAVAAGHEEAAGGVVVGVEYARGFAGGFVDGGAVAGDSDGASVSGEAFDLALEAVEKDLHERGNVDARLVQVRAGMGCRAAWWLLRRGSALGEYRGPAAVVAQVRLPEAGERDCLPAIQADQEELVAELPLAGIALLGVAPPCDEVVVVGPGE